MRSEAAVTLDDMREVVADLAGAMRTQGASSAAGILDEAATSAHDGPPDELLELRSALVRTRAEWEVVGDVALLTHARQVLAAAKRLAIAL